MPKVSAQSINRSPILPEGLGLAIHFTTPQPGEMDQLAKTGSRIIRADFFWHSTERDSGEYDFSNYDRLIQELARKNIRPLFILDYANPLYDQGLAPYTETGRQAFAKWVAAAVQHFQGRNIIWEMWNEPNLSTYWQPKPNVENYAKLALSVGKAIRSVAPKEIFIGPSTSSVDFEFLEACFKAGLLNYWSGISVHPYRGQELETVAFDYRRLRLLIAQYAPKNKSIPIISSEWGYSSIHRSASENDRWNVRVDETLQAKLVARQWLHNLANNIPISIWYDWHDDGPNISDYQNHFGVVHFPYVSNLSQVYVPKPSYNVVATLTKTLSGYRFNKRLSTGNSQDYILLFNQYKSQGIRLVAWTTSSTPRLIQIPVSPGRFYVVPHTGGKPTVVATDTNILTINATNAPQYIIPVQSNDLLQIAGAWERLPLEIIQPVQQRFSVILKVKNPLSRKIQISSGSRAITIAPYQTQSINNLMEALPNIDMFPITLRLDIQGMGALSQSSLVVDKNALIRINSPLTGRITTPPIDLIKLINNSPPDSFQLTVDGDPKVWSAQSLSMLKSFPTKLPFIGRSVLQITYSFDKGWKYIRLLPPQKSSFNAITGKPKAIGVWVYGDGSGNFANIRFMDATKQSFQSPLQSITWKGWRYMTFPMDAISCTDSWGGANDKVIHYPIKWSSIFAIASAKGKRTQGEVYVSTLNYIW